MNYHDLNGHEIPDNTPAPHRSQVTRVGNLMIQLQTFIRGELSRQAEAAGQETEEEANDFDLDDDEDTWTAYEEEDYRSSYPAEQPPQDVGNATGGATPLVEVTPPDGGAAPPPEPA